MREPLLQFLLLGAVIFSVDHAIRDGSRREPDRIVITEGQIAALSSTFARTWLRPPTRTELDGLIQDRLREEVFYREAKALGLDRDDTIIRRRLRQKMEFVSDDIVAQVEPTDEELAAYLKGHPDVFRKGGRFTFKQVSFHPEKRGGNLGRDLADTLNQLRRAGAGVDVSEMGDSRLLEPEFVSVLDRDIARLFGDEFVGSLAGLPVGQWHGPIGSGVGMHLVCVTDRTLGELPKWTDVRQEVRREWENERRQDANERFYRELLRRYSVTIETPPDARPVSGGVAPEAK